MTNTIFLVMSVSASLMSAVATIFIACYSRQSKRLTEELKDIQISNNRDEQEFRQQLNDLYQAIAVSTLVAGMGTCDYTQLANKFKANYKGKIPIIQ